jgi:hypothetical protein
MPIGSRSRPPRRPRATPRPLVAALALLLALGGVAAPGRAADPVRRPAPPPGLSEFMGALAVIESGGRYDARNPQSGAYGKYQIMPFNWPSWSRTYLGARAPQTPRNQERVAAGRLSDLFGRFGSWDRTAYWWLTGKRGPRYTWSRPATRYVDNVMSGFRLRRNTPAPGQLRRLDDAGDTVRYAGAWKTATHRRYAGGGVHFATKAGAAFGVRFGGRGIRIEGPVGPTRGRAALYVDGRRVGVVDLKAGRFRPRATIVSLSWKHRGQHWVELRVIATSWRPTVAVDRVVIRG